METTHRGAPLVHEDRPFELYHDEAFQEGIFQATVNLQDKLQREYKFRFWLPKSGLV